MPTRQQDLDKARHNERTSRSWESAAYTDWAVSALFYAALHWLAAYLAGSGIHPPSHAARQQALLADGGLARIYRYYRRLRDRSEDARYRCLPCMTTDVRQLRTQHLGPLRRHLQRLIGI